LSRTRWLTALAVLCVTVVFFFPVIQGPYSAVHGPVTALQSALAAARLRISIVQAAFNLIGNSQIPLLAVINSTTVVWVEPQAAVCAHCSTILRC